MKDTVGLLTVVCLLGLSAYGECCPQKMKDFFIGKPKVEFKVEMKGCYPGEAHFSAAEYSNMKITLCNGECYAKGFTYMGLQNTKCFCETMLQEADKVDDSQCQTPCPGNEKEKCGGDKHYNLYVTAPKYEEPSKK